MTNYLMVETLVCLLFQFNSIHSVTALQPVHQDRVRISGVLILGEACKQVKKANYYNKKYIKELIIILAGY